MLGRRLRSVLVATVLVGSLLGGFGAAVSSAATARSFSVSGVLMVANANTNRVSIQVGSVRQSIVFTARTHFYLQRRQVTVYALRPRMRVTVSGVVHPRWREALVVRVGPGPVPAVAPAPANASLQRALGAALQREQYALASYQNVVARLGAARPFANILGAEAQHVATLKAFFAEYRLERPATSVTGAPSPATAAQACALGVSIERSLVSLYNAQLPNVTGYPDVHRALGNFRAVSLDNHLPAFERCAA